MSAHIFAHLTATRVRWEEGGGDDPIEEHGWVDRRWSMCVLHDRRNDVTPVVSEAEDSADLADYITDALNELPGGPEGYGDATERSTFYASDTDDPFMDNPDGWTYSYAIHFTRKHQDASGWREDPFDPRTIVEEI